MISYNELGLVNTKDIYAKAIEESCMIVFVDAKDLTVGDWLYEEIKVGKKVIKPNWQGLDEQDLKVLQRRGRKVKVKQGIPFTPGFLAAFVVLLWLIL